MNKTVSIAELNKRYMRDAAFAHLRTGSNFVPGDGPLSARVMIIGEAPGRTEDAEGRPFIGRAGAVLERMLEEYAGIQRNQCYITNVLKFRPPGNRDPEEEEASAARGYLAEELMIIEPAITVLCGKFAYQLVFPDGQMSVEHGKERYKRGRLYLPTYHPAVALYNSLMLEDLRKDFSTLQRLLLAA